MPEDSFVTDVLRPLVIVTASISALSALLLLGLCLHALRWAVSTDSELRVCVQMVLASLGAADFVFALALLVSQLPTGAFGASSGGIACYVSAVMNEFGGLAMMLSTCTLAHVLHAALAQGVRPAVLRARIRWFNLGTWGGIAVFEAGMLFGVYVPRQLFGPEPTMPWCHWRRTGIAYSQIVYGALELGMLYMLLQYVRIHCHVERAAQQAALLSPDGTTADDVGAAIRVALPV